MLNRIEPSMPPLPKLGGMNYPPLGGAAMQLSTAPMGERLLTSNRGGDEGGEYERGEKGAVS